MSAHSNDRETPPGHEFSGRADMVRCEITRQWVEPDDAVMLMGYRVCAEGKAILLERLKSGQSGGRLWRDGATLIMEVDAELPNRCVICNEAATELARVKGRPMRFSHNAVCVDLPLCRRHWRQKTHSIRWIAFTLFIGLAMTVIGFYYERVLFLVAALLGCFTVIVALLEDVHLLGAERIDDDHVRIHCVGRRILQHLPRWPSGK